MNLMISQIPPGGTVPLRRLFQRLSGAAPARSVGSSLLLALTVAAALLSPAVHAEETQSRDEPVQQKQLVNINTADAGVLSSALTGVGQARAEAIVRYREMYGPFESIEELMEVSGVGEATLSRNREVITLE